MTFMSHIAGIFAGIIVGAASGDPATGGFAAAACICAGTLVYFFIDTEDCE